MKEPLILTFSGKHLNPLNIRPEDVCVEDVAHQLSLINRFNGCTKRPITVAQHVVYVSRLLEGTGLEWQGLHHDDGEAYCGDVTKWLKMSEAMRGFREAEDRAQCSAYEHFGVHPTGWAGYEGMMHPKVRDADKLMVRFEGMMGYGAKVWRRWSDEVTHYEMPTPEEITQIGKWRPWPPRAAEEAFIERFRCLQTRGFGAPVVGSGLG